MVAHIPTINVIRDSLTSPDHGPVSLHTSPTSSPGTGAPEVDLSQRDGEGLQVDLNGLYPEPTTDSGSKHKWWQLSASSEKQIPHCDDAGLILVEEHVRQQDRRTCGLKRRTLITLATIIAILVICAAIGGGVGGYFANKPTPTSTSTPTSTQTAPVTSGTTGMALVPCGSSTPTTSGTPRSTPVDVSNPYLTIGATFNITCRRGIPSNSKSPVGDVKRYIRYNITSCMDECAREGPTCSGIIYGANLTAMLQDGVPGANCILKNDTWVPTLKKEEWFASALKI